MGGASRLRPGQGQLDPENYIPSALFMPDGTVVPVCVVQAEEGQSDPGPVGRITFPETAIGGGYPVLIDVQGQEHVASIGCLVTDGHLVYAMTNRHVAGAAGEKVYTMLRGEKVEIGVTSPLQLQRKPFQEIYPEWPGKDVFVDLDVGLIEVADKTKWTAQVYGIGAGQDGGPRHRQPLAPHDRLPGARLWMRVRTDGRRDPCAVLSI